MLSRCISTAFVAETLLLPLCFPTAFAAKALPSIVVLRHSTRAPPSGAARVPSRLLLERPVRQISPPLPCVRHCLCLVFVTAFAVCSSPPLPCVLHCICRVFSLPLPCVLHYLCLVCSTAFVLCAPLPLPCVFHCVSVPTKRRPALNRHRSRVPGRRRARRRDLRDR